MRKHFKIAVIGTHDVGKTTLCNDLHVFLSKKRATSLVLDEAVRSCPKPIHGEQTAEATLWIFQKQLENETNVEKTRKHFIICDRSTIDSFVYYSTVRYGVLRKNWENLIKRYENGKLKKGVILDFFKDVLADFFKRYDLFVFVNSDEMEIKNDGFRNTDEKFQKNIQKSFKSVCGRMFGNSNVIVLNFSDMKKDTEKNYLKTIYRKLC